MNTLCQPAVFSSTICEFGARAPCEKLTGVAEEAVAKLRSRGRLSGPFDRFLPCTVTDRPLEIHRIQRFHRQHLALGLVVRML